MGGQLATGSSIYMASAGVPAADGAGLSSIKSFSQLLTSIAAMPLAGGTFIGHVLFTDNTYDIGASGATRPRTVYAGTSVITPLLNNSNAAALTLGNSTYGVTVPGAMTVGSNVLINAAAGFSGYIFDIQIDGTPKYRFNTNGAVTLPGSYEIYSDSSRIQFGPASNAKFAVTLTETRSVVGYGYSTGVDVNASLFTVRDAANTLAQRNGNAAQTSRLYNTYTSSTNFENLQTSWVSNEARIGTSVGSVGGTQRNLVLGAWDSAGSFTAGMTLAPSGAATFSGDISMQKATQGYIRSHGPGAVGRYTEIYHDDNRGYVKSNFGGLNLNPDGYVRVAEMAAVSSGGQIRIGYNYSTYVVMNGFINYGADVRIYSKTTTSHALGLMGLSGQTAALFECQDNGGNDIFTVEVTGASRNWSSGQTKYTQTIHDGTNGIISTSAGNLNLVPGGGTVAVTGAVTASGTVTVGTYTVATLPAAGSNAYSNANVSDSNAAASGNYGATVAGGGSNKVRVFSDGTNWVIA